MNPEFSWTVKGKFKASLPEDAIVSSFLAGDVGADPDGARELAEWLEVTSERSAEKSQEYVGEGYTLVVDGQRVVIESNYDLFPKAEYPVTDLIAILLRQAQWLRDHLPDRPAR